MFISRGKQDDLATRSFAPGISVYGEKKVEVTETTTNDDGTTTTNKIEYRLWNPFRSKIAAAILAGIDTLYIQPGSKVLYLGAASGTTVSHVSDIVGPEGRVFAVEFSRRSGRDLISMCQKRHNVNPIVEDARKPASYRLFVNGMVDVIFCDVAQPDPARIIAENAGCFLKVGGKVLLSIKANCIDSTAPPAQVYAQVVEEMRALKFKPKEQISLGKSVSLDTNIGDEKRLLTMLQRRMSVAMPWSCLSISATRLCRRLVDSFVTWRQVVCTWGPSLSLCGYVEARSVCSSREFLV